MYLVAIPSFYEEFLFRGYILQSVISGLGPVVAIVLQALLFGALHYTYGEWMYILNASLLSIMNGVAYYKTRNLALPIDLHFGFNIIGFYWDLVAEETPRFMGMKPVFDLSHPFYTLGVSAFILLLLALPLRPQRRDRELWERYVKSAS
jgi:membrane protease YdiL (CAAX protease family)